jgi:hypothetical protein
MKIYDDLEDCGVSPYNLPLGDQLQQQQQHYQHQHLHFFRRLWSGRGTTPSGRTSYKNNNNNNNDNSNE